MALSTFIQLIRSLFASAPATASCPAPLWSLPARLTEDELETLRLADMVNAVLRDLLTDRIAKMTGDKFELAILNTGHANLEITGLRHTVINAFTMEAGRYLDPIGVDLTKLSVEHIYTGITAQFVTVTDGVGYCPVIRITQVN